MHFKFFVIVVALANLFHSMKLMINIMHFRVAFILFLVISCVGGIRWFYIENLRVEPDGSFLVVDVDNDIITCPGAKLIVCPKDNDRHTQHWRWQGRMLINKANRMAIDVKCHVPDTGLPLIVFIPSNSSNQRWLRVGKYLVSEINEYVMALNAFDYNISIPYNVSLIGRSLQLFARESNDIFKFRLVEIFEHGMIV